MVFPLLNIYRIATFDPGEKTLSAASGAWWQDLPARYIRTTTYLGLALFSYAYTFPLDRAAVLSYDWMLLILARNVAIGYLLYGGWHHFLYQSRYVRKMTSRKFNPKFPSQKQWDHDRFWSTVGFCIQSAIEIGIMHLWATGKVEYYLDFWQYPLWSVAWMAWVPYWHDFHFWFIHRQLHMGVLYKWVHSLHHKSFNPGPWSGMSMHPVETTIYFSSALVPALFFPQVNIPNSYCTE